MSDFALDSANEVVFLLAAACAVFFIGIFMPQSRWQRGITIFVFVLCVVLFFLYASDSRASPYSGLVEYVEKGKG